MQLVIEPLQKMRHNTWPKSTYLRKSWN
uniref:Uncharacterized protein n=1 Tax=Arundo donax TaxID=35708 RepID=A0A0A8Y7Z2_ARUDO